MCRNPFKDRSVRQAVAHALNIDLIIQKVLRWQATATGSFVRPLVFPKLSQGTASFIEFGWTPTTDASTMLNGLFRTRDACGGGTFSAGRDSNPRLAGPHLRLGHPSSAIRPWRRAIER